MSTSFPTTRLIFDRELPPMPHSVRLSLFVLFVYSVVFLADGGLGFSLVRDVTGFVLLSFVPGYLVVDAIKDEFHAVDVLYAVGLSVTLSMFVGWVPNSVYLQLEAGPRPLSQPTISFVYVGAYGLLTAAVWYFGDRTPRHPLGYLLNDYDPRILLVLLTVPTLSITGAVLINRTGFNGLTLFTIFLVGLVPVCVYTFDTARKYYPAAIAAISLALVLQNTIIVTYLGRGDGLVEYEIGRQVLQNGFWVPLGGKAGMPRIGVLHPVYALIMDLNLFWEYKLIHPLLFALVPVITYEITSRYFCKDIAFLSATLYIFLPRTYQLLGRNTRTGSAIMFTAFLLLVLLDDDFPQRYKSFLAFAFFWSVITSHYGIGPLVLFAIVSAFGLNFLSSVVLEDKRPTELPFERITLYAMLTIIWYMYLTSGTFGFVTNVIAESFTGEVLMTSSSTATRSISFAMPSFSYQVMLFSHLLVGVLTSLGLGLVYLRYLGDGFPYGQQVTDWLRRTIYSGLSERTLTDSNYLHLAAGIYLFFPLSFGPQVLSAGRTFGLVMMLLAPFPILLLRSTRFERIGAKPALASLFALLLVTSGFVSATVTHDVSPQPEIDGEDIVESGSTLERFTYYQVSTHRNTVVASTFVLDHVPDRSTLGTTTLGKFVQQFHSGPRPNLGFTQLGAIGEPRPEYVYLSEADTVTGTNTDGLIGFTYFTYQPLPSFHESNRVYTTGRDELYYNAMDGSSPIDD
ncbi:DUF2206 domain-containing protein [Haloplanus ruber]|uniref:DUF2206 domain-containing protein n=1 Tax=Haloplanus ruber TaxID=869892 RepID=A0ABD6CZB6_9EURY|nr:DUF2206 domain-containing protein [Haloplanus ruber]